MAIAISESFFPDTFASTYATFSPLASSDGLDGIGHLLATRLFPDYCGVRPRCGTGGSSAIAAEIEYPSVAGGDFSSIRSSIGVSAVANPAGAGGDLSSLLDSLGVSAIPPFYGQRGSGLDLFFLCVRVKPVSNILVISSRVGMQGDMRFSAVLENGTKLW